MPIATGLVPRPTLGFTCTGPGRDRENADGEEPQVM